MNDDSNITNMLHLGDRYDKWKNIFWFYELDHNIIKYSKYLTNDGSIESKRVQTAFPFQMSCR